MIGCTQGSDLGRHPIGTSGGHGSTHVPTTTPLPCPSTPYGSRFESTGAPSSHGNVTVSPHLRSQQLNRVTLKHVPLLPWSPGPGIVCLSTESIFLLHCRCLFSLLLPSPSASFVLIDGQLLRVLGSPPYISVPRHPSFILSFILGASFTSSRPSAAYLACLPYHLRPNNRSTSRLLPISNHPSQTHTSGGP
ncbi:hypothetical protein LX32DRAFT_216322 [Colletotrichum zoysiae]|uniref:Uncharacterized protein n=1 Tax=Colletotrichum zoysiae TaxID=1216348 RepID=A0AAD9LXL1_9PEZI|nr:hypothetical protein LX32DRAFT_216322 [Colletotrichum zoysiae]